MPDQEVFKAPSQLSIGLEFEFAIAVLNPKYQNPTEDGRKVRGLDQRQRDTKPFPDNAVEAHLFYDETQSEFTESDLVRMCIADRLREAGLNSEAYIHFATDAYYGPDFKPQNVWWVERDSTVRLPDDFEDMYTWYEIEINSPAMFIGPEAVAEVKTALQALTSTFRINSNGECGLHIHVGNADSGFALGMVKDLMSFLWTFEPSLLTLHPPHRHDAYYCSCLRKQTEMSDTYFLEHSKPISPFEAMSNIQDCKTLRDLESLVRPGRNTGEIAYRIRQMITHSTKRTIEFRQHAATLDVDHVLNWLAVCVGIVELVRDTSGTQWFYTLLFNHLEIEMDVFDLLELMGLKDQVVFYRENPGHSFGSYGRLRIL